MAIEKHQGSCHCGDVRYAVDIDPTKATRCNCNICMKLGVTVGMVKPDAFELLTDESKLDTYSRFPEVANRYFCKRCHILCFGKGNLPELGGDFVAIAINTLDSYDVGQAEIGHWDGRHDNWEGGMRPTPWPTGSTARA